MHLLSSALHKFRSKLRKMFSYNQDACVELVDALSCNGNASSVTELSLSMERSYSSISHCISDYYKPRGAAPDDYKNEKIIVDKNIENILCQQIGNIDSNFHVFATDVTPYKRSYSKKLEGKSYIYDSSNGKVGVPISIGHKYSAVGYITNDKHWALPVSVKELSIDEKESSFGVRQWLNVVNDSKNRFQDKPSVGLFDAAYSNAYGIDAFIKNKEVISIFISRLRSTRILMRPYKNTNGEIDQSGRNFFDLENPFSLSEEETWGAPSERKTVSWLTKRGKSRKVEIQLWDDLRMRGRNDCPVQKAKLTVIKIYVTDDKDKKVYKNPLWLVAAGDVELISSLELYWSFYKSRFDMEHFFRFGKQRLLLDAFQTPDQLSENNWMLFPVIAYHQLYHARVVAEEVYRQWDKKRQFNNDESLSPAMTQRDMGRVINSMPRITLENKARGISSGRNEGQTLLNREDSPVNKKTPKNKVNKASIVIIPPSGNNIKNSKPQIKYNGVDKSDLSPELSIHLNKIMEINQFRQSQGP